jgi:hypothetical protein
MDNLVAGGDETSYHVSLYGIKEVPCQAKISL